MLPVEELTINPKFEAIYSGNKHTPRQLKMLRELIEQFGYEDIEHWRGMIVDGHTRYSIWEQFHKGNDDAPQPGTIELHFSSEEQVIEYIKNKQESRRNLTQQAEMYERAVAAEGDVEESVDGQPEGHVHNNGRPAPKTKRRKGVGKAAESQGVSRATLHRDEKFKEAVDSLVERGVATKKELLGGSVPATRVVAAAKESSKESAKQILEASKKTEESPAKLFAKPLRALMSLNEKYPWGKFRAIENEIRAWCEDVCKNQ